MPREKTLKQFLTQSLSISYKEVYPLLESKRITVNGLHKHSEYRVRVFDQVVMDEHRVLQESKKFSFKKCYKPRGVECTLNKNIENTIAPWVDVTADEFILGRLDKESEGLLLVCNDGMWHDRLLKKEYRVEKEYLVELNKKIDSFFLNELRNGVTIMGVKTLPAQVFQESAFVFRIVLVQGLNRQIRRMCFKLGYEVNSLKRIRFANVLLDDMKLGELISLSTNEIKGLEQWPSGIFTLK